MGTKYLSETEAGKIRLRGPVIEAGISIPIAPQIEGGGDQEIKFRLCSALLDTGAAGCMINPTVAAELDLPVHSFGSFCSVSEDAVPAKMYVCALSFPPPLRSLYDFVPFLEAPRDMPNHDLIIGRDILAHWHIVFDIGVGRYSISA